MATVKSAHSRFSRLFERLPLQEKINFSRHLAIVTKAGLPVMEGLRVIKEQATLKVMREVLDQMIADVERGQSLADSLESHRHIFGDFFINIIRVGETSGTLSQNLFYLADELKKAKQLRSRVRSAMVYPIVILVATVGITAFLTFVVFPKILPVFSGLDIELPATTRFLISVLDFSQAFGWQFLVGLAVFSVLFRMLLKVGAVRYLFHRLVFFLPVASGLVVNVNMTNFARILGLLLKSGIRIVESIVITSNTFENMVYQRILGGADDRIRRGEQLAECLGENPKFFPTLFVGMIKIGENTGNLEENLGYLSDYYAEEVDNKIAAMTSLLEPVLLLIMGFLVGFVAISIILPIYSISSGLSN